MKKQLFTFTFIFFCLASYAQSTFTEATFTAMMNRLQTDPAFFKNEADPGFTITFGSGSSSPREGMIKFAENNIGLYKREDTNLKVSQVGSTAIATGTLVESFLSKENPTLVKRTSKNLFTYTFAQMNGKWWWVAAQHTPFPEPKFNEAENKATAAKYLEEIINHKRPELLKEVFTDDIQIINGKESGHLKRLEDFLTNFFKAFPDINYTIEEVIAEGNKVFIKANVKATHKGEFWGYQPLGNKLDIRELFTFTMENGKVKSHTGYPDMSKLDKQLKATQ